ncbi:MAG: oligosaccharide flippase family protein, partial [Ignavibacteriaceae bacterium]|jgi:O-antigen/teichoic acid export membrane protein|nr:oligosaccharide flippase family protein [Ignavibacteriaceae bacterium]
MQPATKVSSNVTSIFFGRGVEMLITLVSVTLIARNLGVEQYGLFSSIVALTVLLAKFIDIGFAPIVFRETSKKDATFDMLNTAFTLRTILILGLFVVFNGVSGLTNLSSKEILLSNILFLNIIFSSKYMNFRELLEVLFKVNLNMFNVMLFNSIDSIFLLVLVFLMPYVGGGIEYLVIVYVAANIPGFLLLIIFLSKNYKYQFSYSFKHGYWLIKESIPLFGTVILTTAFQQLDVLLLRSLDSEYSVGLYSAALRLTVPLSIIPQALITTIFPLIVRGRETGSASTMPATRLVYKILFLFSFAISFIITFKAEHIIRLIFGVEYANAYLPMTILFWSILFTYFNTFTLNLLTVYNKQKYNFFGTLLIVIVQIILVVILTPIYSYSGVAVARVAAGAAGTIFFIFILKGIGIQFNFFSMRVAKWLFPLVIGVVALSFIPFYAYLPLTLILTVILTIKVKYFSPEEINLLLRAINYDSWKSKFKN